MLPPVLPLASLLAPKPDLPLLAVTWFGGALLVLCLLLLIRGPRLDPAFRVAMGRCLLGIGAATLLLFQLMAAKEALEFPQRITALGSRAHIGDWGWALVRIARASLFGWLLLLLSLGGARLAGAVGRPLRPATGLLLLLLSVFLCLFLVVGRGAARGGAGGAGGGGGAAAAPPAGRASQRAGAGPQPPPRRPRIPVRRGPPRGSGRIRVPPGTSSAFSPSSMCSSSPPRLWRRLGSSNSCASRGGGSRGGGRRGPGRGSSSRPRPWPSRSSSSSSSPWSGAPCSSGGLTPRPPPSLSMTSGRRPGQPSRWRGSPSGAS